MISELAFKAALNIRIPELLFLSKCHIYSLQPPQEYPSWVPPGLGEWVRYPRIRWQWAEKPGGCSTGLGGPEAGGHVLATHILSDREVPGQGLNRNRLATYEGSAHIRPLLPGGVICPGLPWTEEFPRMLGLQAKTGTAWGKPSPEACWYFKQQGVKTERWRQKWMQLLATLPLSGVTLTKQGAGKALVGAGFQGHSRQHSWATSVLTFLSGQLWGLS